MEQRSFYRIFKDDGLKFGWKHAKKDFFFFLQIFVLMAIVNAIPNIINRATGMPSDTMNVGNVITIILGLLFGFGLIKIFLLFAKNGRADLKDLWNHNWVRFLRWILAKIITGVLVMIGFVLLIIPGIYVAARLYLFEYFVIDKDMNAIEAISASREMTRGHVWEIIGVWLLSFGITLLGALALVVGLLRAIPTINLAQATLYKKLTGNDHHVEGDGDTSA